MLQRCLLSCTFLLLSLSLWAQTPQRINYQAVARNSAGSPLNNQLVALRLSIIQNSPSGNVVYSETHSAFTNTFGLFNLEIGGGTVLSGNFSAIDWGSGSHFLRVDLDPNGGTNYNFLATTQLLSVPYALYAETTGDVDDADADPSNELQTISQSGSTVTLSNGGGSFDLDDADADPSNELQTVSQSGSTVTLSNGGGSFDLDDADADPSNEIQSLNLSGNTLTLSNGNSVSLPTLSGGQVQALSKSADSILLSPGGGFVLDAVDDADADPNNELQTISKTGNTVSLSNGGGSFTDAVDDADNDATNELQTVSKMGNTISLSNGGGSFTDAVDDADADATNELQILSLSGSDLSLSNGGGTVTLPTGSGSSVWTVDVNDIYYSAGNVGIGTVAPTNDRLNVNGSMTASSAGQALFRLDPGAGILDVFGLNGAANVSLSGEDLFGGSADLGNISLYNTAGAVRVTQAVNGTGDGFAEYAGANGNANVIINSVANFPNRGYIGVAESGGFSAVEIYPLSAGEGYVEVVGSDGDPNVVLASVTTNPDFGFFAVADDNGNDVLQAYPLAGREGFMGVYGTNGNLNLSLSATANSGNQGYFAVHETSGFEAVVAYPLASGQGYVEAIGANGTSNVIMSALANNASKGSFSVYDDGGFEVVSIYPLGNNEGFIETFGPNGFNNFTTSSLNGNSNHGYMSVNNASGFSEAGMLVDAFGDGIVFGDLKNFRMQHPEKPDHEIWYASLEGPEAAAYERGTAELVDGKAVIDFSEHFQHVANPQTMTVMLTPLDGRSKGLAVIEKTATGFVVQELHNGQGNYRFDWEVKCVRQGYEDYQVVRSKESMAPSAAPQERAGRGRKGREQASKAPQRLEQGEQRDFAPQQRLDRQKRQPRK